MKAAKKADTDFGVTLRSTKHTVRDASGDVTKMAIHLMEHTVTVQARGRTSPPFKDVTDGFKKMSQRWLKQVLMEAAALPDDETKQTLHSEIELDYELYDVVQDTCATISIVTS